MSDVLDPKLESEKQERRRINRQRSQLYTASRVLFFLFFLVFCISLTILCIRLYDNWKSEQTFRDLSAMLSTGSDTVDQPQISEPTQGAAEPSQGTQEPGMIPKYRAVYEMNSDLFGWISIADTQINYPVMHTPQDEEYYLRRGFDGASSWSGVPFIDAECSLGCGNYIIYGHNMFNGTMFSELLSYQDKSFWESHPTIQFDTLYQAGEYQVMAAFYSRVFYTYEEDVFRYYNYSDLTDQSRFEEFVTQAKAQAAYDTGVVPEYGDEIITLITCSYGSANERFVVIACKKSS